MSLVTREYSIHTRLRVLILNMLSWVLFRISPSACVLGDRNMDSSKVRGRRRE